MYMPSSSAAPYPCWCGPWPVDASMDLVAVNRSRGLWLACRGCAVHAHAHDIRVVLPR